MVGRGLRSGINSPALDRHLIPTSTKLPIRSSPAGRARPSPTHIQNYTTPTSNNDILIINNNSSNNNNHSNINGGGKAISPIRGIGVGPGARNRSTSPNRTKSTPPAAGTGAATPIRSRLNSFNRHGVGDIRDPAPASTLNDRYEENIGEAVCDYDTSATVLYELLESSSWERARSRCRSHPDEVRTWIVRKDKSLQVRWKLLPLHAAIIFQAPNFLVSTLLEKYPGAASRKDDQGMLPLHLAFRHKQEDEDLLELLLVHYPKAVLIKDRRERVPLEHGRESKFTAKLMRLYADSTVAATRALSGNLKTEDCEHDGIPNGPGILSGGQRAILEAEYKEKILAVKVDYEKQIRKIRSQLADELAEADQQGQEKILAVKDEYEKEIRTIKESHDRRLTSVHEHHQNTIRQLELASDEERQALIEQHTDELNALREVLANQVAKDKGLADSLEKEIAHLQIALQESRTECELARNQTDQLQALNNELQDVLQRITDYQLHLQEIVSMYQEQLENNRSSRYKLIQTLLRNEDDHGEAEQKQGSKINELFDKVRRKVDFAREKGMLRDENQQQLDSLSQNGRIIDRATTTDRRLIIDRAENTRIDSRMDRERVDEDHHHSQQQPQQQQQTLSANPPPRYRDDKKQERPVTRDEVERERLVHNHREHDHFLDDEDNIDNNRNNGGGGGVGFHETILNDKNEEQEYGEVRILADEISAITENSDF